MTENKRSIPPLNEVEDFNPANFTRELPNEGGTTSLYLDVKYRLLWFRLHRPNGKIDTEIVSMDDKSAVVSSKLYADRKDAVDHYIAKSYAQRFASDEKYGNRYLEIAETAAIGRVLAAAGYGTQFCGVGDMLNNDIVDAPIDLSNLEDNCVHETDSIKTINREKAEPIAESELQQQKEELPKRETLEDYINTMTLKEAKDVVIPIGRYAGSTLGEIALTQPKDLDWYVKFYRGNNLALKAGAILLVQEATKRAV